MTSHSILTPPVNRRRLGADVTDRLREAILQGYFSPGDHLREIDLSETLQVSRGPVREALVNLEREGLVEISQNRGAFVTKLSELDLERVYSLRLALEGVLARWAVRFATEEDLAGAEAVLREFARALKKKITEHDAARYDMRFHDLLYQASGHPRLYAAWAGLRSQNYLFLLSRNIADPDWRESMVGGHMAIVDAIRARDADRAAECMTTHVEAGYSRVRRIFDPEASG